MIGTVNGALQKPTRTMSAVAAVLAVTMVSLFGCGHRAANSNAASSAMPSGTGGSQHRIITPNEALNDPNTPASIKAYIRMNVPLKDRDK